MLAGSVLLLNVRQRKPCAQQKRASLICLARECVARGLPSGDGVSAANEQGVVRSAYNTGRSRCLSKTEVHHWGETSAKDCAQHGFFSFRRSPSPCVNGCLLGNEIGFTQGEELKSSSCFESVCFGCLTAMNFYLQKFESGTVPLQY